MVDDGRLGILESTLPMLGNLCLSPSLATSVICLLSALGVTIYVCASRQSIDCLSGLVVMLSGIV